MPVPTPATVQAGAETRDHSAAEARRASPTAAPEEPVALVADLSLAEHARRLAAGPAGPAAPAGPSGQDIRLLASLQRRFGNEHVTGALAAVRRIEPPAMGRGPAISLQRQGPDVAVTDVKLSAPRVTIPLSSGVALTASAVPPNATGVKFSVEQGTVAATGVTIDATTGAITIAGTQQGGTVKIKATSSDSSEAWRELQIIEKPVAIASTSAVSGGGSNYGGQFTHTFTAPSGKASGLLGSRINETFDSLSVASPFGGNFTLSANAAGSAGWVLDSGGTMTGPDNVDIGKDGIDLGRFTKSASNASPKALPAGFPVTQHLHAKSLPADTFDAASFTDTNHVRTLTDKATFTVEAGKGKTEDPYDGPPAYTNAKAAPASVVASDPKPKKPKGGSAPAWNRNKVQVTADVVPAGGPRFFSITGAALGCEVDAATGEVLIGDQDGTITVRVAAKAGRANFDEVTITITKRPAPVVPPPGGPGP